MALTACTHSSCSWLAEKKKRIRVQSPKSKIKQQYAFNRAYGHGKEHIKYPNELNSWDEHAGRLRNDAKYREQYKKNPMRDGDDTP